MHMADALISPAVGGAMWAAAGGLIVYSSAKVKSEMDDKKIPLMGVMGAFIFAAQMINFAIPGTGSSGHIGGGLLLAVMLGPHAGFLTMASVLFIQAFFFADGGLLAMGCNIFNLGFFTCFIAYPLIYKKIASKTITGRRITIASLAASLVALQFGAFSVVIETLISGITSLDFKSFLIMMQSIHLAIGLIEGAATAAVIIFIHHARPEIIEEADIPPVSQKKILITMSIAALLTAGILSWFASENPDGLEWSILKSAGIEKQNAQRGLHSALNEIQKSTSILPDYNFKDQAGGDSNSNQATDQKPVINPGTSYAGIIGGIITFMLIAAAGFILKYKKRSGN